MSVEQAEKKKAEIAAVDHQEKKDIQDILKDVCPNCGTRVVDFSYFNTALMAAPFGWIECPNCGVVFCPESLRHQKISRLGGVKKEPLIL
jgi:predicted RNA-binding Zn-ribbon protein involved in translation (DUF1610 family)